MARRFVTMERDLLTHSIDLSDSTVVPRILTNRGRALHRRGENHMREYCQTPPQLTYHKNVYGVPTFRESRWPVPMIEYASS